MIILSILLSQVIHAQNLEYRRIYKQGDTYKYKFEATQSLNSVEFERIEAVSKHTVVVRDFPGEVIQWESMSVKKDGAVVDESELARRVSPYLISLDGRGKVAMPPLNVDAMMSPITDLNTIFVSVSPALGVGKLKKQGDVFEHPLMHRGVWTNSSDYVLGEDCMASNITLLQVGEKEAVYQTAFEQPKTACLTMRKPWMQKPVRQDLPNNVQQIKKRDDGKFDVMWGAEVFSIKTTVAPDDGKILSGVLSNTINFNFKAACDSDLENCVSEQPVTMQRTVSITLQDPKETSEK